MIKKTLAIIGLLVLLGGVGYIFGPKPDAPILEVPQFKLTSD